MVKQHKNCEFHGRTAKVFLRWRVVGSGANGILTNNEKRILGGWGSVLRVAQLS